MLIIPQTEQNSVASHIDQTHILRIKILSHIYWKNPQYITQRTRIKLGEEEVLICLRATWSCIGARRENASPRGVG